MEVKDLKRRIENQDAVGENMWTSISSDMVISSYTLLLVISSKLV